VVVRSIFGHDGEASAEAEEQTKRVVRRLLLAIKKKRKEKHMHVGRPPGV
jgi:hypothetical protein